LDWKGKRYYNGVRLTQTTTSCSAIALVGLLATAGPVQIPAAEPRLFPVRAAWTLPLNSGLTAPPAFSGTHGYFPLEDERLAAYDVVAGMLQWVVHARAASAPVAGGGLVYLAAADAVSALREDDGSTAWQVPLAEELSGRLVWDAGWLVAATKSGHVLALRASDGQLIWEHDAGARVHAPPAFGGDRVYVSLADSRLVALDVMDGTVAWERHLGGPPNDVLALDDRVYVGSDDNFFYCLRIKDGQIEWRWRTGGDVIGTPVADADRV
jgi:outer membrane protein assembly factor BamB